MDWKLNLGVEETDLVSEYFYNTKGQVTSTDLPDQGVTDYLYDQNGNLRFIRDAKYNSTNEMIYRQYDDQGRLMEIGKCLQTDDRLPGSNYFNYFIQEYAYGQLPAHYTDSDNELVKYFYDENGYSGAVNLGKKIEYEYNFAGNPVKVIYDRGGADQLFYFYEYCPDGQLFAVYTNTTDDNAGAQCEIKYNATNVRGQQTQIILGNNTQAIDYNFDPLYGWLNKINDPENLGTDKFAMRLYHNETPFGGTAYYNGAINSYEVAYPIISGIPVLQKRQRYDFTYDKLMRIKGAHFYYTPSTSWINGYDKFKLENIEYDDADNILTLRRYDMNSNILNDYYYKYNTGINQLKGRTYQQDDFSYNSNGSMSQDVRKDITDITYNFLKLPETIELDITGGRRNYIHYGYDDQAQRLFKKQNNFYETIYIRGIDGQVMAEYDHDSILRFWRLGAFGHKTKESGKTSYYYLKDHLGNIIVTINDGGTVVTKDDYYPFGLQMPGLSYNSGNANDRIKYSGKELDEEHGLNKYHFGWRDYPKGTPDGLIKVGKMYLLYVL